MATISRMSRNIRHRTVVFLVRSSDVVTAAPASGKYGTLRKQLSSVRAISAAKVTVQHTSKCANRGSAVAGTTEMNLEKAPNYAEARGGESRADFIHKLGIVQKELNETSVWLRIALRISREKADLIVAILQENIELARIITASIRTAKARAQVPKMT